MTGTLDSSTGFSARVEQYARRSSRADHVGNNCVRMKSTQSGGLSAVGVGDEKIFRRGSKALRCVSIESSEYCRDLRRKSIITQVAVIKEPFRRTVLKQRDGECAGGWSGGGGAVSGRDDI